MSKASHAFKYALLPIAASLLVLSSVAPAAIAANPGPVQMVFLGQFSTPDGRQFFVGAALFGQANPGPVGNSWTLTGRAVIVERDPGPTQFEFGTFSVTGTLTQTPASPGSAGGFTFNFVLKDPGPAQRTSLTPGTSFNAVFSDPGPVQFQWSIPSTSSAPPLSGSGSGFVTIQPGPIQ